MNILSILVVLERDLEQQLEPSRMKQVISACLTTKAPRFIIDIHSRNKLLQTKSNGQTESRVVYREAASFKSRKHFPDKSPFQSETLNRTVRFICGRSSDHIIRDLVLNGNLLWGDKKI